MRETTLIDLKAEAEQDSIQFAKKAIQYFKSGDSVLLYGNLGSGKTFLTKKFCHLLGVDFDVNSPTFSIVNQYQGDVFINHLDFYRIENKTELHNLGLDDLLNMESINFIEWPQIIEQQINWEHFRIYIEFDDKNPNGRYLKLIKMSN